MTRRGSSAPHDAASSIGPSPRPTEGPRGALAWGRVTVHAEPVQAQVCCSCSRGGPAHWRHYRGLSLVNAWAKQGRLSLWFGVWGLGLRGLARAK